jgi:osmoprotectant transport system ATP-binding protein
VIEWLVKKEVKKMIEFKNVSKLYPDGTQAVHSLDLRIRKGEFFIIIGPSGSGKTTTLKMMNRLIDASNGSIIVGDKDITEYDIYELRWNIGYVLQQIALFPHLTVEENISIVPELKNWSREKTRNRVNELLDMVGLEPSIYRSRKPKELSGGQQQRIGVARALAADPEIILMDEPFSAIDPISREKLQNDMLDLKRRINKTIVFVTHDIQEALKLGDRICIMKDGGIVQVGTPKEIIQKPVNEFVRKFVGIQKELTNDTINLEETMHLIQTDDVSPYSGKILPVLTTLEETLAVLSQEEQLQVEKDGEMIGTITRQAVIQYLADRLQERGLKNE